MGFFLKLVIADRLNLLVVPVYNNVHAYGGFTLLLATYLFSFQIFCDFAGYSIIAIGAARVLGFQLMENFRRPYFAKSIAEFWQRWHISLLTWFRDYLYIPLGGNRVSKARHCINIFFVFFVSGIWHGAGWNFIAWGVCHGIYRVVGILAERGRMLFSTFSHLVNFPKIRAMLNVFITFHLVTLAWVFFRAPSFTDAWYTLTRIFTDVPGILFRFTEVGSGKGILGDVGFDMTALTVAIVTIILMGVVHLFEEYGIHIRRNVFQLPILQFLLYLFLCLSTLLFGVFNHTTFIYFQF